MRIHPRTIALSFVLLLLVLAVWQVRGQFAGIALYRVVATAGGEAAGWGYMSPTGAGANNGTWGNDWTPAQAAALTPGTRVYPVNGTYTNYDPDWTVTQPSATPESYTGTGEPQYWSHITPAQIP